MAKKCIACNTNKYIKILQDSSFLGYPTYACEKCGLCFLYCTDKKIEKKCQEYYNKDYWSRFREKWDDTRRLLLVIIRILRRLKTEPLQQMWHYRLISQFNSGKRFLDIGCGTGDTLIFFSKKGYDVRGIEPDLSNAKRINSIFGKQVCTNGSAEKIKINEKFDVIYLCHVFEHLIRPDIFLEKIKGNLNPEGIIFIEVPNCENKKILKDSIDMHPHVYNFTYNSMKTLFESHNFKILKLGTYSEIRRNYFAMFFLMLFKMNNYKQTSRAKDNRIIIVAKRQVD